MNNPVVSRVVRFIAIWRAEGWQAAERHDPTLAAAIELNDDPKTLRKLKILAIANCTDREIADRLGLDPLVVETWVCVFFDVRKTLKTSWPYHRVIGREKFHGDEVFGRQLHLAWIGRKEAAMAILDLEDTEAHGATELLPFTPAEKIAQRFIRSQLALDAAIELAERSPAKNARYLAQHGRILLEERRIELARLRLEERCRAIAHKREMERLQVEAEIAYDNRRAETEARVVAEELAKADERAAQRQSFGFPTTPTIYDADREPPAMTGA